MQADSKSFFSSKQIDAISGAVEDAESKTSGEIVPVLASASDDYDRACFLAAILVSLILTSILAAVWILNPSLLGGSAIVTSIVFLSCQFGGLLLGFYLANLFDGMRRAFIPRDIMQRRVSRAAHEAFLQFQISHTENATGILIYVSLFERMVFILADRSINKLHDQQTWDGVRNLLIEGLRVDDGAGGMCRAIARCGEILEVDFPIQEDDKNELSNRLRLV